MQGLVRCEPDDPLRCQQVTGNGQCPYVSVNGVHCPMHNKSRASQIAENRNYRLTKFQARVDELADNAQVKNLREEVGLIRMLIEEVVNQCHSSTDLILMSNKISDLIMKAEKLVSSCHRLESATGLLLNKTAVVQLASILVEIIGQHIQDDKILDSISIKIIGAIASIHVPMDKDGKDV